MPKLTTLARKLRQKSTEVEQTLWRYLRAKQCDSYKFRRQQPIGKYIVDFVCFEKKLIIELDGGQHFEQLIEDQQRDDWLKEQGFIVLRFWNNDLFENREGVYETIRSFLIPPSPTPPIKGGALVGGPPIKRGEIE
ncbi:endonuclease domain-containing protein [Candidatus Uhrbacteria bacterium]|nr:endonuclease domain-containing protein [Candidatus Uhrbacteria bacterium]